MTVVALNATYQNVQVNLLNINKNLLEIWFEYSFLKQAFIFNCCFFVVVQRTFHGFFLHTDADENRDVTWGSVGENLREDPIVCLHVNSFSLNHLQQVSL